ncbi:MAG: FAD-dependent monooxygenase [Eubacterium sp.]|nr:FAD-dependent monooxygenase [Eubacterium sp.]
MEEDRMHHFKIAKRSIDARKKPDIFFVYSVSFDCDDEEIVLKNNKSNKNLQMAVKSKPYESKLSKIKNNDKDIIVVGAGPAGLFAAYVLTLRGLKPILIDRGATVEERVADVEKFWIGEGLDEDSNVCFGEGGAGTFSDGKLNSGVKDSEGRKSFILETFVRYGAPKEILYDSMPHIGTDVLRKVIANMRNDMIRFGCRIYYHTRLVGIDYTEVDINKDQIEKTNQIKSIRVISRKNKKLYDELITDGIKAHKPVDSDEISIPCDELILAIGHSARDTFKQIHEAGLKMEPKPFAVGVRVQHRQSDIDHAQYGDYLNAAGIEEKKPVLPAANYKLTGKTSDGRGVYSFCMCPGGYVVNASSEKNRLVVNGMSDAARDSGYANSAIVVQVSPVDDDEDIFSGVEYQRRLEENMYNVAVGQIPVQRFSSFIKDGGAEEKNEKKVDRLSLSKNQPAVKGVWKYADVRAGLDDDIAQGVIDGIKQFGKKIKGFDANDTLILGLESRTSSPIRILRDETLQSPSVSGVYPCGEGAGYAGGILSAALDGLKVAEAICQTISTG